MRNQYIDRLRGIAVLTVMISHSFVYLPWYLFPLPIDYTRVIVRNGYYGVCLFFAISGFLITGKVVDTREKIFSTREFYAQRVGRILPCLILMVAASLALALFGVPGYTFSTDQHPISRLLLYIFTFRFNQYLTTFGSPSRLWDVLWSLSIEEVFYLSFPFIFSLPLLIKRIDRRLIIVPFLLAIAVIGPIMRAIYGRASLYYYFGEFDQIALGSLTAMIVASIPAGSLPDAHLRALRWTGLGLFVFIYFGFWIESHLILPPSFVALAACLYLVGSSGREAPIKRSARIFKPLERFGVLSYELYLFHMLVLYGMAQIVIPLVPRHRAEHFSGFSQTVFWLSLGAYLLIMLGGSALISRYFSERANKAIRRRFSRTAPRCPTPAPSMRIPVKADSHSI